MAYDNNQLVQTKRTSQGWMIPRQHPITTRTTTTTMQACYSHKLNSATPGTTMMTMCWCRGWQGREPRLKQGQQWQRQQWLWQQQTTTETMGVGNNQQNAAVAAAVVETAVIATAIVVAWRQQRQWLLQTTGGGGGGIGCGIGGGS